MVTINALGLNSASFNELTTAVLIHSVAGALVPFQVLGSDSFFFVIWMS